MPYDAMGTARFRSGRKVPELGEFHTRAKVDGRQRFVEPSLSGWHKLSENRFERCGTVGHAAVEHGEAQRLQPIEGAPARLKGAATTRLQSVAHCLKSKKGADRFDAAAVSRRFRRSRSRGTAELKRRARGACTSSSTAARHSPAT